MGDDGLELVVFACEIRFRLCARGGDAVDGSVAILLERVHEAVGQDLYRVNVAAVLLSDDFVIGRAEIERMLAQAERTAGELDTAAALDAPASAAPLVREYRHLHSHSAEQLREAMSAMLDQAILNYPADEQPPGSWWLPASYGGSAPTPEEARRLDREELAARAAKKRAAEQG